MVDITSKLPIKSYQETAKSSQSIDEKLKDFSEQKSFADHMGNVAKDTVKMTRQAEQAMNASHSGNISMSDLIPIVNEAGLQLKAAKSVWQETLQQWDAIVHKTQI